MQVMRSLDSGFKRELEIPDPRNEVIAGVPWGRFDQFHTPAFWLNRVWVHSPTEDFEPRPTGSTLAEEIVACLLGGHGVPAEVAIAAFYRLRDHGLIVGAPEFSDVERSLSLPLIIGSRRVKYRFVHQKAKYVSQALDLLRDLTPPDDDLELRSWLLAFPGVGLKTASWIVRNVRHSDVVAIIDIHIHRACVELGVFPKNSHPAKDYVALERRFLDFAYALGVRPSVLDSTMWYYMRRVR